jgi:hypothetical protein
MARVGDDVFVTEPRRGTIRRFRLTDPAQPSTWTTDVFIDIDRLDLPEGTLREPTGITADVERSVLYVSDRRTHVVVALNIDTDTHDPRVVAGQPGRRGFAGDDEAAPGACVAAQVRSATSALLNAPEGVLFLRSPVDDNGYLYVADTGNNRVRRVARSDNDRITTVLGDGSFGSGGDGPDARSFPVAAPRGLATDDSGNLFVTSGNAVRVVQADTFADRCSQRGVVDGFDRVDSIYGRAPRENFPEPVTRCLSALALDPRSTAGPTALWAVDSCVGLLLRLQRTLADSDAAP